MPGVECFSSGSRRSLDKGKVYGEADFEDVDAVFWVRKFRDARGNNFRFGAGKFDTLLIHSIRVANELQEKRDRRIGALRADLFNECVFVGVNLREREARIVEKEFDGIGSGIEEARNGPAFE